MVFFSGEDLEFVQAQIKHFSRFDFRFLFKFTSFPLLKLTSSFERTFRRSNFPAK